MEKILSDCPSDVLQLLRLNYLQLEVFPEGTP